MADPPEAEEHEESSVLKDLRAKAKRVETAESEAAQLRQELALTKAGLDGLNDKQVKALVASHDGEFTAEAIKATADELGFAAKVSAAASEELSPEQEQARTEAEGIAKLTSSPAEVPRTGVNQFDVNQYNTTAELFAALRGQVDESFGPELPSG